MNETLASNTVNKIINDQINAKPDSTNDTSKSMFNRVFIAFDVDKLPSKGISYNTKEHIKYYPFNIGEMKKLQSNKMTDVEIIEFLLGFIETPFNKMELTYFDFLFISTLLKLSVLGDEMYNVQFECPVCGHVQQGIFRLSNVEFKDVRYDRLPVIITIKDHDYKFMPLTVGNMLDILKNDKADDINYQYSLQLRDEENPLDVIENKITGVDVNKLEVLSELFNHGNNNIILKCSNIYTKDGKAVECGSNVAIPFQDVPEFIDNEGELSEDIASSIRFGV